MHLRQSTVVVNGRSGIVIGAKLYRHATGLLSSKVLVTFTSYYNEYSQNRSQFIPETSKENKDPAVFINESYEEEVVSDNGKQVPGRDDSTIYKVVVY